MNEQLLELLNLPNCNSAMKVVFTKDPYEYDVEHSYGDYDPNGEYVCFVVLEGEYGCNCVYYGNTMEEALSEYFK